MAHIELRGQPVGCQITINGVDFSHEVYRGIELVEVGGDEFAEVGLRLTLVVSRLDIDTEADVTITDNFRPVAQKVRSVADGDA